MTKNQLIDYMVYNAIFNYNLIYVVATSAPIHAFMEFLFNDTQQNILPSHWLVFCVETLVSDEKGMTVISPKKEIGQVEDQILSSV